MSPGTPALSVPATMSVPPEYVCGYFVATSIPEPSLKSLMLPVIAQSTFSFVTPAGMTKYSATGSPDAEDVIVPPAGAAASVKAFPARSIVPSRTNPPPKPLQSQASASVQSRNVTLRQRLSAAVV